MSDRLEPTRHQDCFEQSKTMRMNRKNILNEVNTECVEKLTPSQKRIWRRVYMCRLTCRVCDCSNTLCYQCLLGIARKASS